MKKKKIEVIRINNGVQHTKLLDYFPYSARMLESKINNLFPRIYGPYFVFYHIREKNGALTEGYFIRDKNLFDYIKFLSKNN
jgi:hypothetical protein